VLKTLRRASILLWWGMFDVPTPNIHAFFTFFTSLSFVMVYPVIVKLKHRTLTTERGTTADDPLSQSR